MAGLCAAAIAVTGLSVAVSAPAEAAGVRVDLRALVIDDGSVWVKGITDQFSYEGVPFTTVTVSDTARPTISASYLAAGAQGRFNAVILPDDSGGGLPAAEMSALTAYEAQFGVRQVDAYTWANPTIGLNYAQNPGYIGDLTGMTGTVTAAAQTDGFGYLSGTLPIGAGSYGYLATPADATVMPAGGSFTPLITVPIPGTTSAGSLIGVYANGGVEKLVITGALSTGLSHFRLIAHGIVTWVTRGVHFGYNRNYLTFHFDDAFSYDARWSATAHCTPGEDCPAGTPATPDIRMTAADVANVAAWEKANGYQVTLAFNGYYSAYDTNGNAWNGTDGLTNAFVANKSSFLWLNHGYQHVYQGCTQNFTVLPWACTLTSGTTPAADGSNISWVPQAGVSAEISQNIAQGKALGLPFDASEYLSGEHSGLYLVPQQPVDNPNFAAALTQNGIRFIGADASREPGARVVGSATTVPRHPVAVYYNVATQAEEVSEYNWFYNTRANGGSGYCEDNPATATCLSAPLDPGTAFASYIVPSDSAYDLRFILSNDPRPFYAHVSNLTGPDYLGLTLIKAILTQYRTAVASNAPLVNLSLAQASDVLAKQQAWNAAGMGATPQVTGYVQDGKVTITNPTGNPAPVTVPAGTTVNGAPFGSSYGGEQSAWVSGPATLTLTSLPVGSTLSFESVNYPGYLVRQSNSVARIDPIGAASSTTDRLDASFVVDAGLASAAGVSLESGNNPGYFLKVENGGVYLRKNDSSAGFASAATFKAVPGLAGAGISLVAYGDPTLYLRHQNYVVSAQKFDGTTLNRQDASFTPRTAPGPMPGNYQLINAYSGLAMAPQNSGRAIGTSVVQDTPSASQAQSWQLQDAGNGSYKIMDVDSRLYLGITAMSTANGGTALIWSDNGTADHLWRFLPVRGGQYLIVNTNSGKVLGVSGMSKAAGAPVLQWDDNGTADHVWSLTRRAFTGTYQVRNTNSGLAMAPLNNGSAPGTAVVQSAPSSSANQSWRFQDTGDGSYKITNVTAGLVVGISGASRSLAAPAILSTDLSVPDQRFRILPMSGGHYLLVDLNSRLALGVGRSSRAANAAVIQWTSTGVLDQRWDFTAR